MTYSMNKLLQSSPGYTGSFKYFQYISNAKRIKLSNLLFILNLLNLSNIKTQYLEICVQSETSFKQIF